MTSLKQKYLIVLVLSFLVISCSFAPNVVEKNPPPDWVLSYSRGETVKGFSGSTAGIGYSEPTFYEKDAWRIASKNARAIVARSFSGKIRSLLFENMEGEEVQQEILTKQRTDVVLKNSRIVDVWIDRRGISGLSKAVLESKIEPMGEDKKLLDEIIESVF